MKRQIRYGVFETNSSSTHSMTIFTEEQYDLFHKGELYLNRWHEKDLPEFCTAEMLREHYPFTEKEKEWFETEEEYWYDCGFQTEYFEDEYLETDTTYYTTPGGEKLVMVCKYGYDG